MQVEPYATLFIYYLFINLVQDIYSTMNFLILFDVGCIPCLIFLPVTKCGRVMNVKMDLVIFVDVELLTNNFCNSKN